MSTGCQQLIEDYENLTMPLSSLLSETEILKFLLHCRTVFSFRYSGCAFLPAQHFPLKDNWKTRNLWVLKCMKLGNYISEYCLPCVSIQSQFRGLYMLTAQNSQEVFSRIPFKSSKFQRGNHLSNNNESDLTRNSSSVLSILKNNVWQRTLFKKEKKEEFNECN